ncbi:NrpR regulatory domain-containing protein [Halobacterium yunchengense]|uniref:NrpR regulatory domain-containing protein n=1 Tax=Halobacterium yunchengense TaxID=3108497 RepID=UPI00300983AA
MDTDLDRRTYDLLRLVDEHGPIGSIQLVELMQLRGYDIKDRTIRLKLSELDGLGLTEKVPGKGRRLTEQGRMELKQGDVDGRLEHIRARIATLTSRVSYDPIEDAGVLVASAAYLDAAAVDDALDVVERLDALPLGPVPVSLERSADNEPGDHRLLAASSITLDGVLLAHGVNADLATAGVLEYELPEDGDASTGVERGGRITRYVDVINGEGSSIDVITLLVEAGRSDVSSLLDGGSGGLLIGDDRDFPMNRFEEARDLTAATRDALGGVFDFQRPREKDGTSAGSSAWAFGSVTYVGTGELVLSALAERDLTDHWETLYGTVERNRLGAVEASRALPSDD